MRKWIYVAILPLFLTFACTGERYREQFDKIDSTTAISPERALAMLDSMKDRMARATKQEQMRYNLLRIKAEDKAYIMHTTDSMIIPIVEYYEDHGNDKELAEAYYYAASVYRDMNDAPMALNYFQKALEILSSDGDLKMKSNAYCQAGILLKEQYLYDEAIKMIKSSYECDSILKDTILMAYNLNFIGYIYDHLNETDSCFFYFNKAYEMAESTGNHDEALKIRSQMASSYIKRKDYAMAKKCLQPVLHTDTINKSPNYCMAADIYMGTGQYDSAQYYNKELLKMGTIYAKKSASRMLIEISLMKGQYEDAAEYIRMYEQFSDSVNKITATESIAQMSSLYNYQLREKENARLKLENSKRIVILTVAASVCVLLILIMLLYNTRIRLQRKELETRVRTLEQIEKERLEQSEERIRENKRKIERLEQQLNSTKSEKEDLIKRLEEQKADLTFATEKAEREIAMRQAAAQRLMKSEAHDIVVRKLKSGKTLGGKEWEEIDKTVNDIFTDFKLRLYSLYRMSEQEYHICLLIRLGMSTTEISSLLSRSASAISLARKRLYVKIFNREGTPKEFDDFINSL